MIKSSAQCIVMPLKSSSPHAIEFAGLALHFLLGNVMVLNSSLDELWFGWRVKKIFSDSNDLLSYCLESNHPFSIHAANEHQNIRYWVSGEIGLKDVHLSLYDARKDKTVYLETQYSERDDLVGFRRSVVNWMASAGIDWTAEEKKAALWTEACNLKGLENIGKALLEIYLFSSFGHTNEIELHWFESAVKQAPDSFVSHDLLGWAYYRDRQFLQAMTSFKTAISINPGGAGAMAGLMWCCVMTQDEDNAVSWAQRKAAVCGKNREESKIKALRLFQKHNSTE